MNAGTSLGMYKVEDFMNRTHMGNKTRKKRFKPFINIDSTHFETNVSHKDERFNDISLSRPQTIQKALHPIDQESLLNHISEFHTTSPKYTMQGVIKKALNKMDRKLDEREMKFNEAQSETKAYEISKKPLTELENMATKVDERLKTENEALGSFFGIYYENLVDLIQLIPKSNEFNLMIDRILDGLKRSHLTTLAFAQLMQKQMDDVRIKFRIESNIIKKQYQEFREKNNLDAYFTKYLSDETLKKTLFLVEDLMNDKEDWFDQMKDYKESLDKFNYSETETRLQNFYEDLLKA